MDSLIVIFTAPGQNYVNIAEEMMSILNIGFQNVALERKESPSHKKSKIYRNPFNQFFKTWRSTQKGWH